MSEFLKRIQEMPANRLALLASELQIQLERERERSSEAIAIIGLAGRYPGGCETPEAFWELLAQGRDALEDTPPERWDIDALHDADPDATGKIVTRRGSFIRDFDCFDADFFGIPAAEAATMDPQHRLLLEVGWEALEATGMPPEQWKRLRTGVYVAICTSDYADLLTRSDTVWDGRLATGTAHSLAAGRLSYTFGLDGPCLAVDTACSSSLIAAHLACMGLRSGECDMALVGGVNVLISPLVSIDFSRNRILSPSGLCRPFDARADGYVRGEGCGMMVLKRLSDARRDGDPIRALIRGSAMNHVGRGGLMTPKASSQEAVIRQALAVARIDGAAIDYLEASSVGTAVGDPIEVEALRETLCQGRRPGAPLLMGSVKTNIGHLEASAGMAALTKVVLSLEQGLIPPHLNLEQPNPEVPWSELPLRVPLQATPWPAAAGEPRRAGVSAFAISGSNAHLVLEQAPPPPERKPRRPGPRVLPLSAKSEAALQRLCLRYAERLAGVGEDEFEAVCATAATGRLHHARRVAVVADTAAEAVHALRLRAAAGAAALQAPRMAFLFPACGELPPALMHELPGYDGEGELAAATPEVAWFKLQLRLAQAWRQWGAQPSFVAGEQGGECAAACTAGLFGAPAAEALVAARGDAAGLARACAGLAFQGERLRIVSGLGGRLAARGELAERDYWQRQGQAPALGAQALAALAEAGVQLCLVMGPAPEPATVPAGLKLVATMAPGRTLAAQQAVALGALYEAGVDVDWNAVWAGRAPARVALPTYPFERRRYWPATTSPLRVSAAAPAAADAAPQSIGQLVRRELARLLGGEPESIDDSAQLVELGLDSLRALQLKDRLSYLLKTELPVAQLAGAPTVGELTRLLERQSAQSEAMADWPAIVPDPDGRHEAFALTEIQQAYWIGRNAGLELGGVATHAYFEYQLAELDIARLEQALQKVVARHDMLRAIVQANGRQVVLRDLPPYHVRVDDYRGLDEAALEETLQRIRRETSHEVRPADRWPLFEVRASLLPGGSTRLHVSIDLLIVDAWSIEILAGEIALLYAWPDASLPPLELTFRDFMLAQGALENSAVYRRSERYWKARVPELPPAPQLPVTMPAAGAPTPEFVRRMGRLDAAAWGRVQADARRAGVSPTVAVLTAFAHVLRDWSRSPKFTVNLTLFHRPPLHPQINDVIGDFTSLTLLEADLSGERSFEAQAMRLQHQLWSDLDHRYFGGVRVLRELARQTGRPAEALMPVVFTAALGLGSGVSSTLDGELVYAVSQTPQVWLDHQVLEDDGELVVIWDAVEALFPPGLLDDMFEAYTRLLGRLGTEPEPTWAEPVPALLPQRQLDVRRAINMPPAPVSDALLHGLFAQQVAAHAGRPAVIAPGLVLSHAELARRATALARRLREHGAAPNRLVAIVMDKGWEQVVAALAILEAGAAYVPIDARTPRDRLWALLDDCAAQIVVTQPALRETVEWPAGLTSILSDFSDPGEPLPPLPALQRPQDLAYVIFTSGSSGRPKGVMIDHRGAVNTVLDVNRRFGIGPDDRTLALSSLSFDLSVWDIFGLLAAGGAVVMPQADALRDPAHWVDLLATQQVTVWNSVPALMQLACNFVDHGGRHWPEHLRLVMLSGDWIPVPLPAQLQALSPRGAALQVVSLGGATEASIWSVFHPVEPADRMLPSIPYGRPLANQGLHVLDDAWRPRPDGVPGQLFIEGIGLAQGYWGDAAKTAASFVEHRGRRLYRTGDLARYRGDGTLEFLGREDAQVKVQGFRIELGEIESQLARHPAVQHAAVLAVGERTSRRLVACVVLADGAAADAAPLREHLAGCLPEYMIPGSFVLLPALPLTPNGKVDARELERIASESGRVGSAAAVGDDNDALTQRLLALVKAELQIAELGVHTNLMQVGANSLDMLGLVNEVERQLGFRPKVEEFFRNPSIAGLRELRRRHEANEDVADTRPLGDLENIDLEELAQGGQAQTLVLDPRQRETLKRQSLEPRRFDAQRARSALLPPAPSIAELEACAARRSHREFDPRPLPLQRLARTLACLRRLTLDGKPRHLYGSAGGLYPVQTYLSVKAGRVDGLAGGTYYLDPVALELVALQPGAEVPADTHVAYNQAYFDASAFSVYLVAETGAIGALYGDLAGHLCCIEAGLMAQLLELWGAEQQVGFCQIGSLQFEGIRGLFDLRASHTLVHTLVGGGFVEPALPADEGDVEEGTI